MKPTSNLPDDAGLPGLAAIRALGLARALPELELGDQPVELQLVGYSRGLRATLEARAGDRHFAVKCYARDADAEAGLYEALASAGLVSNDSDVRVPRLLARERTLTILVLSWLEGPAASELIADGDGARAGELAARWLRRSASLDAKLRPIAAAGEVLSRTTHWADALGAADASVGSRARGLAERLSATVQDEHSPRVVNGRFYVRHVLDLGDAAGVIDWEHFGRGPLEVDAGMFLATLFRSGRHEVKAQGAAQAEEAFRRETEGLLDGLRLAWYRAGALLSLAYHLLARNRDDWQDRALAFLDEAERSLMAAFHATRFGLARATAGPPPDADAGGVLARNGVAAEREAAWRTLVEEFAARAEELFEGDVAELVCQLVRARDVKAKDLARVIALLEARERELEGGAS